MGSKWTGSLDSSTVESSQNILSWGCFQAGRWRVGSRMMRTKSGRRAERARLQQHKCCALDVCCALISDAKRSRGKWQTSLGGWNLKGTMGLDILTKGSTSGYARLYRRTPE
jgi:hypothetical protein